MTNLFNKNCCYTRKILDSYFKNIKKLERRNEIGGYVSLNPFRTGSYPKKYKDWFKGGTTSNPITWDQTIKTKYQQHQGILYTDDKVYPNSVKITIKDGLVWANLPRIPKRLFLIMKKNYHFADINLFWKDIEINTIERCKSWNKIHLKKKDSYNL